MGEKRRVLRFFRDADPVPDPDELPMPPENHRGRPLFLRRLFGSHAPAEEQGEPDEEGSGEG